MLQDSLRDSLNYVVLEMTETEKEEMTSKARTYSMQFGRDSVWAKLRAKAEAARSLKDAKKHLTVPSRASEVFDTPDEETTISAPPVIGAGTVEGPPLLTKTLGLVTDSGPAHYDSRRPMATYRH